MKRVIAVAVVALAAGLGSAQERIAPEEAQKYARLFVEQAGKIADLQLRLEPEADKAFGLKKDDVGALVIPARGLSAEVLQKIGKDVTPLGQLWVRNLTVLLKDRPVPNDQLRVVTVTVNDKDHLLPLFLLGARKKGDGMLELVVYAREKEPLLVLPLRKAEPAQELPIELEARGEEGRGVLTLNILGTYQAQLALAKQEQ